jgi:hypothetical protein
MGAVTRAPGFLEGQQPMARVRMRTIAPHSTHDFAGAQIAHAIDDVYEVEEIDADNLTVLGFAQRLPESEAPSPMMPPPTPQAPSAPVAPMTTATMPTTKTKAPRK